MKAIPTPTKEQCARVAQEVNDLTTKCIQDNSALFLIALARKFGFRGKRLNDLILEFNATEAEYQKYSDDGVFDETICKELSTIGVEPKTIYTEILDIKQQIQKNKKYRESKQLSLKEQYEMKKTREKMFALRDYMEGKNA